MEFILWLIIPLLGVMMYFFFSSKKEEPAVRSEREIGIEPVDVKVLVNRADLSELRQKISVLEKEILSKKFLYAGNSEFSENESNQTLHYLSVDKLTVISVTIDENNGVNVSEVGIGSESIEGDFYMTFEYPAIDQVSIPSSIKYMHVSSEDSIDQKLTAHKQFVANTELKKISSIEDVVEGINRCLAIHYSHGISSFYGNT